MPKTRRRSYKSKKRPRTARKKKRGKKKRSSYKAPRPGRYQSLTTLYKNPVSYNQTIQRVVSTLDSKELYNTPVQTDKIAKVTNSILTFSSTSYNLQQCFEKTPTGSAVIPEFVKLVTMFRQIKFQSIKITLTPERYLTVSPGGFQTGDEKDARPIDLYYINDDGSAGLSLNNPSSINLVSMQPLSAHQHGKMQFTKPISFYISPSEKLSADKSSPNYTTFRQWTDTKSETDPNLAGTTYLPNDSFYYGFRSTTDIPADFRYKVHVQATILCRDLIVA
jgi:hypothetical protein